MRTIAWGRRFRKDFRKRIAETPLEEEFWQIVRLIATGQNLPPRYRDHPLSGSLAGSRDFHLRPDLVVIYERTKSAVVLRRVGSHEELFD